MKKIKILGKSIPVFVLILLGLGIVSAALLTFYGKIVTTVNVEQSITLDNMQCTGTTGQGCTSTIDVINELAPGGEEFCFPHYLINHMSITGAAELVTTYSPAGGITTEYLEVIPYSFTYSQNVNDGTVGQLEVTVAEDGDWMVWTFDFPVEQFTGDGNLNVGLIIATDGEGNGPAFQIHNDDGADPAFEDGTWLMSLWGPTIGDGWNGWHSGDTNILVTSLSWVEATGNRVQTGGTGDGILQVKIKKSELGSAFHWAASPTVGSGFFAPAYDVTMQIPSAFSWSTPLVTMGTPNYVSAVLMGTLVNPVIMQSGEVVDFSICHAFAVAIAQGTYTITTTVEPVLP